MQENTGGRPSGMEIDQAAAGFFGNFLFICLPLLAIGFISLIDGNMLWTWLSWVMVIVPLIVIPAAIKIGYRRARRMTPEERGQYLDFKREVGEEIERFM